jgi:hypothetical protein
LKISGCSYWLLAADCIAKSAEEIKMTDQEIKDAIILEKEIFENTNWIPVARRMGGYKFDWFLWRLRKARILHMTRDQSVHGEVVHVGEDQVVAALGILNETIGELSIPGTEFTGNVVWDDLPNDHPFFKGQADDLPPPGTKPSGRLFDAETGEPLGGFHAEDK